MTLAAILIPARLHSTRLPGKPLVQLDSKPMIERVVDTCVKTGLHTFVLTDSTEIYNHVEQTSTALPIFTDKDYANGTERCADSISVRQLKSYHTFINVQGDMPDVTPKMIRTLQSSKHELATLFTTMPPHLQKNPNVVKLVKAGDQAIDFVRGVPTIGYGHHHLGMYKFSRKILSKYLSLQIPPEEKSQNLEQLRWLRSGYNIGCVYTDFDGIEINTKDDVRRWHDNRR
jgi:3-deoxy-manno-octulosonate cytidylyltransferase (CMP-KDO synthetase)